MKQGKKLGLDTILADIKSGLNPAQISEKHNIPKQTIGYSVTKLVKLGCAQKVSYGVWRFLKDVPTRPKDALEPNSDLKEIRGHAFIWNIEFLEGGYDWMQVIHNFKKRYRKPALTFNMVCKGKVPRTIFKNKKIWLTKKGLTIYEPLDFLGRSSFSVKGSAVNEMDKLVKDLIKKLGLRMQKYRFRCSREHFAHVKNQMARQFNDNKQKIKVECDGKHFWIDHSDGVDEEETDDPNLSVAAHKFYKSQVKTGFEVTPEYNLKHQEETNKQIRALAEQGIKTEGKLDYFGENMVSHVGAVKILGSEVRELKEERIATRKILNRIAAALEKDAN